MNLPVLCKDPMRCIHIRCNSEFKVQQMKRPGGLGMRRRIGTAMAVQASSRRIAPSQERQRHAARSQTAEKRRKSVNLAKLMTNHILAANSLEQLHDMLISSTGSLDHIHVAALLSRTAHIMAFADQQIHCDTTTSGGMQQPAQADHQHAIQQQQNLERQQLLVSKLIVMMCQRLRHANTHTLVAAVAALGRLSSRHGLQGPSQKQLQHFAARTQDLLPSLTLSQLAIILWGLSKSGYKPAASWITVVLEASTQRYDAAAVRGNPSHPHQSTGSSDAAHRLQSTVVLQRPQLSAAARPLQQTAVLQQHQQHPNQHTLATDLSLVIYALAVMGKQPDPAWLQWWQSAVVQQLPAANMQDLSQNLWALANLGCSPSNSWLEAVLAATENMMDSASAWALGSCIGALSRFSHTPKQQWMASFLETLYNHNTMASNPQALSYSLSSLAKLKTPVDSARLSNLLNNSMSHLPTFSPWQLTNTCWACATLNLKPSAAWIKNFMTATARLADAGRFTVLQLSSIIWSLALIKKSSEALLTSQQLQVMVLLQSLAAAGNGQGLKQLGPTGRSGLAWALANLNMVPTRPWLQQFLAACFEGGLAEDHVRCASVLFCIASLDYEYLVEWLEGFLSGETTLASGGELDLSLEKYAALIGVLQALSEMDSKQLRAAWLDLSSTDWSADSAAGVEGMMSFPMQLPPGLAVWVESMVSATAGAAASKSNNGDESSAGSILLPDESVISSS